MLVLRACAKYCLQTLKQDEPVSMYMDSQGSTVCIMLVHC